MTDESEVREYLGDGVYVKFDGIGFELRANNHLTGPMVYLELEVLDQLITFVKRLYGIKSSRDGGE